MEEVRVDRTVRETNFKISSPITLHYDSNSEDSVKVIIKENIKSVSVKVLFTVNIKKHDCNASLCHIVLHPCAYYSIAIQTQLNRLKGSNYI